MTIFYSFLFFVASFILVLLPALVLMNYLIKPIKGLINRTKINSMNTIWGIMFIVFTPVFFEKNLEKILNNYILDFFKFSICVGFIYFLLILKDLIGTKYYNKKSFFEITNI
jgi:predicted Na+-dependent transporter